MKADRLLSELLLLQAQGRLAERELAERLEVSQRTAHRDMEALCAAGVPLTAYRGAHGGWELEKGWRMRVPGLDAAELRALLMAQPSALGDRRLTAAAERAFAKLRAALSPPLQAQATTMRARLHIDPAGWRPTAEDWSMLPVVQEALAQDCRMTFRYTRPDGGTSTRTVDPLGLVSKQASWYLVAQSAAGMRTFRVSRMRAAVVLAERFKRPAGFDLGRWWRASTERLRAEKHLYVARLAMSEAGVAEMAPWVPLRPVTDRLRGLPEGWAAYDVEFDSAYAARFVALGMGSRARVLGPKELRRAVAEEQVRVTGDR